MKILIAIALLLVTATSQAELDGPVRSSSSTFSVRQGTAPAVSYPNVSDCEAEARRRTTNPAPTPTRVYQVRTGMGAVLSTETSLAACLAGPRDRLTAAGPNRPIPPKTSEGNVNSCVVSTKYSTAFQPPTCVSTYNFSARYKVGSVQTCAPIPGPNPKPRTCPNGQLGAWAQTGTRGPLPECAEIWTPSQPNPGDCFTLDRTATVTWTPPTRNTDGSTLTNLAGYRLSYGTNPNAMVQTVQIANPGVSRYIFTNLEPATWFIAGKAYTSGGTESALSNTAQKVIR